MMIKIIAYTPDPEFIMAYCARASSPKNQEKMNRGELSPAGLLRSCAKHGHWSVFEMANVVVEAHTTRAISAQIIRHRSFSFAEFSQRYSEVKEAIPAPEMRRSGSTNRQSSLEPMNDPLIDRKVSDSIESCWKTYKDLVERGVATETARMVLPLCTPTKLYMNGTVRSWIHYLALRCKPDTQKEHREIALAIRSELAKILPTCAEAFEW